ncbi:divalent-cation tolerance protein [Leptolyngbya sp. Heron Island J]|uniref:divalent-cation tolerance protein CutA n=1 Tax=Leptolyngbya sp. Heron Island J TaxID=1385935 RepID=UPI0003B991F4|nr:divalent-cation tolerance protein CutA [Leptolyngbya sp. Heron Island J]ESA37078.1 divalent-cation tolerance protein [Leptolyngbya sp. Heron Island J]
MATSSQLGLILVTTASESEARTIAESLLDNQLAACVSITPIQSIYRWQGSIHNDAEYQLTIKTDLALFEQIATQVTQQHSYDLPEIIAVPMVASTEAYEQWIREQVDKERYKE